MGFLDVWNKGTGFIGQVGDDWSITYNTCPPILGNGSGRLGSINFSARCDSTTQFTIDNYLSIRHFYDNQVSRWLSAFDVNIQSIELTDEFATFSTVSRLSQLDVVRKASANPSGTFQRKLVPPSGKTYVANSVTYTTPTGATVYDVASGDDFVYVLAQGGHNGEVVHRFGIDGYWYGVWPVYSDATDLASPQSRYIEYITGWVFVGQVAADRIKKFTGSTGAFSTQFGSPGSGDGQFNTLVGIAASNIYLYALDSVLGRVQVFNHNGLYLSQWGTQNTGADTSYFNNPTAISVAENRADAGASVFVADQYARVREYSPGGTYRSSPFGGWDFVTNAPTGPFKSGNWPISTSFDQFGAAYVTQGDLVYKYVHDPTAIPGGTWADGSRLVQVIDMSANSGASWNIYGDPRHGILHAINKDSDGVLQYAGSTGTFRSYVLYYIALAATNFPVRILAVYEPIDDDINMDLPEWEMSVWQAITELCAVTNNSVIAFDDRVDFVNRVNRVSTPLPDNAELTPVTISSTETGQAVQIVNYETTRTFGMGVLYDAAKDSGRTFSANINSLDHVIVNQDTYAEYLIDPEPQGVQTNPFANPSAETNLNDMGYYTSGGTVAFTRDTTKAFSGTASAKLAFTTAPPTYLTYISNLVYVTPGTSYDFRAWVTQTGATQVYELFVDWRRADGVNVGYAASAPTYAPSTGWTELKLPYSQLAPPSAIGAYVQVRVHGGLGRNWLAGEAMWGDMWSDGPYNMIGLPNPFPDPGRYTVFDSNNVLVDPVLWKNNGGRVTAEKGNNPGDIRLTIQGPGINIPGTEGPYSIRTVNGGPALTVLGGGIIATPEVLSVGTGASDDIVNREVAKSINSPMVWNRDIAYTEASWVAYSISTEQKFTATIRLNHTPEWLDSSTSGINGTAALLGRLVRRGNAIYNIDSVSANGSVIRLGLSRYTPCEFSSDLTGHPQPENIWAGKEAVEFDNFWINNTAQDFTIAPLLNPYGA